MKSIKLKNDYYLDSTSVSHNRKKLSEQIHYHNVTTGQITESGRIVDNKKEYGKNHTLFVLSKQKLQTI